MHMQNNPKTMQDNPTYDNLINTIYDQLHNQINQCENANIKDIIIDPGIGFGKTLNHNLKIIKQLKKFSALNYPILIGTSRKSFIGTITNEPVNNREAGTIASSLYAIQQGADIIRVHNVKDMKQAIVVWEAINNEKS